MSTAHSASALTSRLKASAFELGFVLAGATPAVSPPGYVRFREWLDRGYAGEMTYLEERADRYRDPTSILDGVRSVVMLAYPYRTEEPASCPAGSGKISRYAWGEVDYHDVIHDRLKQVKEVVMRERPGSRVRGVVDTAPLLEREFAQLAGLGWTGKNTLLLNRQWGSLFFLAALLTDQELEYDAPFEADHCGSCRACLDVCPTQAFPAPYVLDATKCISYLTIELKGAIAPNLRPGIGDWLFGCDLCQEVCPWNNKAGQASDRSFEPRATNHVNLEQLFRMTDDEFRELFRRTPLWRAKRRGILRNAAIVLGNQRCHSAVETLKHGRNDVEPIVRDACEWALAQILLP